MEGTWIKLSEEKPKGIERALVMIDGNPYTADGVYFEDNVSFRPIVFDMFYIDWKTKIRCPMPEPEFGIPIEYWMPIPGYICDSNDGIGNITILRASHE